MKNETIVLIPHYNEADGLVKSVESIAESEHVDLLIVDDGSTSSRFDESTVRSAFKSKGEIIFLYQQKNGGITTVLNMGLDFIKTKDYRFIARLDAGDLCLGERFRKQETFLNSHPDIGLVGSNVLIKDMEGNFLFNLRVPTDSNAIKNLMHVSSSVIIHPTIMFRTAILEKTGNYPTKYYSEDYAFYFEILRHYKMANLDEFLVEKEMNPNSMSLKNRKRQASARLHVMRDNFYFGFYPVYGLLRNYILYFMPNKYLISIKRIFLK